MFDFTEPATKESQVAKDLRAARRYIERGWCKWSQAHDAEGCAVSAINPKAVEWCVGGAVCAAIYTTWRRSGSPRLAAAFDRLMATADELGYPDFVALNNAENTTKSDVLGLIDLAIAKEVAHV